LTNFKPTEIPKGFVLVIDTDEKKSLFRKKPPKKLFGQILPVKIGENNLKVKFEALSVGDYSIQGFEDRVCVERKQLSDFDAFIGKERVRKTMPKLERMYDMFWAGLAIECSERELFGKRKYGKMTPEHTRGFLKVVEVRYNVHTYRSKDRIKLERWILDRLCCVYETLMKTKGVVK